MKPRLLTLQSFTVERPTSDAVFVDGKAQDRPVQSFTFKGSVQPTPADRIAQLPEGDRGTDVMTFYADQPLQKRDRVQYLGRWYTVLAIGNWNIPTMRCAHWSAIATSEDFT